MAQTAIRLTTRVLPGKRIEITAPELPESGTVELVIYLPATEGETAAASGRYPAALNAEYNALIDKKLARTLTVAEAARLEEVRAEIAAIDKQTPDIREIQMAKLRAELAKIRAEIEALPDAEPTTP